MGACAAHPRSPSRRGAAWRWRCCWPAAPTPTVSPACSAALPPPSPRRPTPAHPLTRRTAPRRSRCWARRSIAPPTSLDVPVRIAVHAVRRVPGGTVLDWSITALAGPGGAPGEQLYLELGLYEEFDVSLIDAAGAKVYRPADQPAVGHAACASRPGWPDRPWWSTSAAAADRLSPAAGLDPPGRREHRHGADLLPHSGHPGRAGADRRRRHRPGPAGRRAAAAGQHRGVPPTQRSVRSSIEVHAVLASGSFTSVVWTVRARSPGPGLDRHRPPADPPLAASGPPCAPGRSPSSLRVRRPDSACAPPWATWPASCRTRGTRSRW